MSRRRGVPLDDPEAVERRRWHLQLQQEVFKSSRAKQCDGEVKGSGPSEEEEKPRGRAAPSLQSSLQIPPPPAVSRGGSRGIYFMNNPAHPM